MKRSQSLTCEKSENVLSQAHSQGTVVKTSVNNIRLRPRSLCAARKKENPFGGGLVRLNGPTDILRDPCESVKKP